MISSTKVLFSPFLFFSFYKNKGPRNRRFRELIKFLCVEYHLYNRYDEIDKELIKSLC